MNLCHCVLNIARLDRNSTMTLTEATLRLGRHWLNSWCLYLVKGEWENTQNTERNNPILSYRIHTTEYSLFLSIYSEQKLKLLSALSGIVESDCWYWNNNHWQPFIWLSLKSSTQTFIHTFLTVLHECSFFPSVISYKLLTHHWHSQDTCSLFFFFLALASFSVIFFLFPGLVFELDFSDGSFSSSFTSSSSSTSDPSEKAQGCRPFTSWISRANTTAQAEAVTTDERRPKIRPEFNVNLKCLNHNVLWETKETSARSWATGLRFGIISKLFICCTLP